MNALEKEVKLENAIKAILEVVENTNELRGGLKETPERAANAWLHWIGGYDINPIDLLKYFEDGAEKYDEMVLLRDIPFFSYCEHHLAPIIGRATVGYVPNGKIAGLSKLARVVDAYSRRLQVQERMTVQIADCIWQGLEPKGVGVLVRARHLCMESRGIRQQGHTTTTQALRGVMYEDSRAREEFIELAKSDVPL